MITLIEFLLARIAEKEKVARALLRDLEGQIEAEGFAADERGPFPPARMLAAQLWTNYDGQTRWRNFARGQRIATLADPARVLAECAVKRSVLDILIVDSRDSRNAVRRGWAVEIFHQYAAIYAAHPDFDPAWAV